LNANGSLWGARGNFGTEVGNTTRNLQRVYVSQNGQEPDPETIWNLVLGNQIVCRTSVTGGLRQGQIIALEVFVRQNVASTAHMSPKDPLVFDAGGSPWRSVERAANQFELDVFRNGK
jgi:hypothetical protein